MLEKFSWEGISGLEQPENKIEKNDDKAEDAAKEAKNEVAQEKSKGNFEMPNSVTGNIIENPNETITFSTKFGDWTFSKDKFKELCPNWEKGEAAVSFVDGEKLAKNVLNELLNSNENVQE